MPFIAYFFVLVLTAVTAAVSLDYLTAPNAPAPKHDGAKVANAPGTTVRQVPIGKSTRETTAQASSADDDKSLSPLYPAAPGKNLPDANSADAQTANANDKPPAAPAQTADATPAANSQPAPPAGGSQASVPAAACAIEACASAYRSFRASDCTYQPYGGARKLCDLSDGARQASAAPAGSLRGDNLDDVVRTVRRLPPPQAVYGDDDGFDDGGSRIVVIQRAGARPAYGPRYIYEER